MDRLELQFVQLRAEMRDEFSAIRGEIREGDERVTATLREEIRDASTMVVTTLMEQIEESRRHTRLLFEETISRIATIQDRLGGA